MANVIGYADRNIQPHKSPEQHMFNKSTSGVACSIVIALAFQCTASADEMRSGVISKVLTEANGDIVLVHEVTTSASVDVVWKAYTTTEGWKAWVTPNVDVDVKVGGVIRANYRKDGKLTDDDAIVNHVINYVPERLLTIQAELGPHFPKVMKDREEHLYNVVTFQPLANGGTKLVSYGTGYKDTPELQQMLKFFLQANETALKQLVSYVETGKSKPHQAP